MENHNTNDNAAGGQSGSDFGLELTVGLFAANSRYWCQRPAVFKPVEPLKRHEIKICAAGPEKPATEHENGF